jgi:competence protein ComEC
MQDTYTSLRLAVDRVQIEDEQHQVRRSILVRGPRYPAYVYGDEREVEGKLETPHRLWRVLLLRLSSAPGNIRNVAVPEDQASLARGGSRIHRTLFTLKGQTQVTIARILPESEASLLTGILLGVETGIPERVKDAFSTSGTMHVVAISGFNYRQTV